MKGFRGGSDSKESACNEGDPGLIPWVGKIPWRRAWQPNPVFFPGEFRGQRSLGSYSPWGHKELDRTEEILIANLQYPFLLLSFFKLKKILSPLLLL